MNPGLLATLLVGGLAIGGAVGYLTGSNQGKSDAVKGVAACSEGGSQLFIVNGKPYDREAFDSTFQSKLHSVEKENFHKKEGILKEQALKVAMAKDTSDLSKLPELDSLLPASEVTDAEVKTFFDENKARLPPDAKLDSFKDRISMFLKQQKKGETFQKKWEEFTGNGTIKLLIREPSAPLVAIPTENFPTKGNKSAKNVVVEISDYLCPHCQKMQPSVEAAVESLGDKVKFVQINFSLRPDKLSGTIVEGAFCASQQGEEQFWKFHKVAFEGKWGAMNDDPNPSVAAEIAKKAGLDAAKHEECMKSPAAKTFVKNTSATVSSLGVTGTPVFFLNNRRLDLGHGGDLSSIINSQLELRTN